jgi:arsenite methyltransferase
MHARIRKRKVNMMNPLKVKKTHSPWILIALSLFFILPGLDCSPETKAKLYNYAAKQPSSKAGEIIKSLSIKPGSTIADLGSGGGYFTVRLARATGDKGRVYCVDIDRKLLDIVVSRAHKAGLDNVIPVLAKHDNSELPPRSVDLIFMRNVVHYLSHQVDYFKKLKSALKPGGSVAIVEHNGRGFLMRISGHYTPRERLIQEMKAAGYTVTREFDFLKYESFIIFKPD